MTDTTPAPAEAPATGTLNWYKDRCWVLEHVLASDETSLPADVFHQHRKDGLILKAMNALDRVKAAEAERDRLREAIDGAAQYCRAWGTDDVAREVEQRLTATLNAEAQP